MIRVRCPHCRELLELDRPAPVFLCPACNNTCRLPASVAVPARQEEEILDVVAADEEPRRPRRGEAITAEAPDERRRPRGRRDEEDEGEDVDLEVVEDGDDRRRRKRRKRRRRRSGGGGGGIDLDWVSFPLILMIVLGFPALIFSVLIFLVNPLAALASLFMFGGGIWFMVIVAEDGFVTLLLCMFVPFYSLYYTFTNFERVAIPFLLQTIGSIGFMVAMGAQARRGGPRMESPSAVVYVMHQPTAARGKSGEEVADRLAPGHQAERTIQAIG
jgi:hypothetical protein